MEGALAMAVQIASKSPVAVQGTKDNLSFSRFYSHDDDGGNDEVCGNEGHQCMNGDLGQLGQCMEEEQGFSICTSHHIL